MRYRPDMAFTGSDILRRLGLAPHLTHLSTKQLSRLLERAEITLRKWRSRNFGPPWVYWGSEARYPLDGVADFLNGNNPSPAPRGRRPAVPRERPLLAGPVAAVAVLEDVPPPPES